MKAAVTGATEAVCGIIDACEPVDGQAKVLRLTVDVGAEAMLTIATKWDVATGMRVVIAVLGSFVNDVEVKETTLGGVSSQGLLCDGVMLGWSGASAGAAALLPSSFKPGDSVPDERPRRVQTEEPAFAGFDTGDAEDGKPLFEAKLTKEEKKALAAKKKAEREAKKNGVELSDEAGAAGQAAGAGAAEKPRVRPTKADLKRVKKQAADKRKAGEECFTDDELEAAGFLLEGEEA